MLIFKQMIILFLLMMVGYVCRKRGLLNDEGSKKISGLVVNVANPALVLSAGINPASRVEGRDRRTGSCRISVPDRCSTAYSENPEGGSERPGCLSCYDYFFQHWFYRISSDSRRIWKRGNITCIYFLDTVQYADIYLRYFCHEAGSDRERYSWTETDSLE